MLARFKYCSNKMISPNMQPSIAAINRPGVRVQPCRGGEGGGGLS